MDTLTKLIKMDENSANILNLSESALNSLKRLDLVQAIKDLKGKVNVDANIYMLSDQISKFTDKIDKIASENS